MMLANWAKASRVAGGGVTPRGSSAPSAVAVTTTLSTRIRAARADISTEFLAAKRVGDLELFEVESRVGAKTEFAGKLLFQFDEQRFVFGAQAVENFGVDVDAQVRLVVPALLFEFAQDFADLALDLNGHRQRALDHAFALAIGAILIDGAGHAFAVALAGHFQEAELRDGQDAGLGFVAFDTFAHTSGNLLLVAPAAH